MAGRNRGAPLTQDLWELTKEAFFRAPGKFRKVAMMVNISRPTAEKAWYHGWPANKWPPISKLWAEQSEWARATAQESHVELAAKAREDAEKLKLTAKTHAVATKAREIALSDQSQVVALETLKLGEDLGASAAQLAKTLRNVLEVEALKLEAWAEHDRLALASQQHAALVEPKVPRAEMISIQAAGVMLHRVELITSKILLNARQALEIERVHTGRPLATFEIQDGSGAREYTLEELEARAAMLDRIIEARREHRGQMATEQAGGTAAVPKLRLVSPVVGEVVGSTPETRATEVVVSPSVRE